MERLRLKHCGAETRMDALTPLTTLLLTAMIADGRRLAVLSRGAIRLCAAKKTAASIAANAMLEGDVCLC